jgi:Spt5 C-terminal nonapeptide repeat binding Spt4
MTYITHTSVRTAFAVLAAFVLAFTPAAFAQEYDGFDSGCCSNSGYSDMGSYSSGYSDLGNYGSGYSDLGSYSSGYSDLGSYSSGYSNVGSYSSNYSDLGAYSSNYSDLGSYNSNYSDLGSYQSNYSDLGAFQSGFSDLGAYSSNYSDLGSYNSNYSDLGSYQSGFNDLGNYSSNYSDMGSYSSGYSDLGNYSSYNENSYLGSIGSTGYNENSYLGSIGASNYNENSYLGALGYNENSYLGSIGATNYNENPYLGSIGYNQNPYLGSVGYNENPYLGSVGYNENPYLGSVNSAGTPLYSSQSGTPLYSNQSGTPLYSSNSGTPLYSSQSGTPLYSSSGSNYASTPSYGFSQSGSGYGSQGYAQSQQGGSSYGQQSSQGSSYYPQTGYSQSQPRYTTTATGGTSGYSAPRPSVSYGFATTPSYGFSQPNYGFVPANYGFSSGNYGFANLSTYGYSTPTYMYQQPTVPTYSYPVITQVTSVQPVAPFIPTSQPTCNITASALGNGNVVLSWNSVNARTAFMQSTGRVALSGSMTVAPGYSRYYLMSVVNGQQVNTCQVYVQLQNSYTPVVVPTPTYTLPSCTLSFARTSIGFGQSTSLNWTSYNAVSAYISDIGATSLSGSRTVWPYTGKTYTMTVYGQNGYTSTCQATVSVGAQYFERLPQVSVSSFVSLAQVPYTGFDLGPLGTAIYALALLAWSVFAGYMVFFYRGGIQNVIAALFGKTKKAQVLNEAVILPKTAPAAVHTAPVAHVAPVAVRTNDKKGDTMSLEGDGVNPTLVIQRA